MPSLTVRTLLDLYLRHSVVDGVHGPDALADRRRVLADFASAHGDLAVTACKPYHLTDWVEAHPAWKSTATRRARANAVRACFQWALDQERIDRNPFRSVRYAEADRRPDMPDPTLARVQALANKPYERALRFLRLTACRLSELCRAVWADVDLERGLWVIPLHKSRKRTRKAKVVALVPEAVELLKASAAAPVDAQAAVAAEGGAFLAPRADAHLFVNTRGTPWTRRTLGQQLARMKKRHRIDTPATLHGIRHRFAGQAVARGAPLKLIAAQLGHSTVAVTERYYVNLDGEMDAIRAAARLGVPG